MKNMQIQEMVNEEKRKVEVKKSLSSTVKKRESEVKNCQIFPVLKVLNKMNLKSNEGGMSGIDPKSGISKNNCLVDSYRNKETNFDDNKNHKILLNFSSELIGDNFNKLKTNFLKKFGENFILKRENKSIYLKARTDNLIQSLEYIYNTISESVKFKNSDIVKKKVLYKKFIDREISENLLSQKPFKNCNEECPLLDRNSNGSLDMDLLKPFKDYTEEYPLFDKNSNCNFNIELLKPFENCIEEYPLLDRNSNGSLDINLIEDFYKSSPSYYFHKVFSFSCLNFLLMKILHINRFQSTLNMYSCVDESKYVEPFIFILSGPSLQNINSCIKEIKELYYISVMVEFKDSLEQEETSTFNFNNGQSINDFNKIDQQNFSSENSDLQGNFNWNIDKLVNKSVKSPYIAISDSSGNNLIFSELKNLSFDSNFNSFISVKFENEIGYFICGKKLGKLFKMNCSCLKVFILDSDSTSEIDFYEIFKNISDERPLFLFEMKGSISDCLLCYSNILNEFPSEIIFNVDSRHHKKIIGAGGFAIQRIMKKYNVYIKFFNDRDSEGLLGNVLIKTPRKNQDQMENAKSEILKMVGADKKKSEESETEKESPFKKIQNLIEMNSMKHQM